MVERVAANRPRLEKWGYETDLVRWRPRHEAFPDVLAAYDRIRRRVGAATPICVWGQSAGAHMALMLAVRRPDVACVVSEAAPTELQSLGPYLKWRAHEAFGARLARWSPALYRLLTPVLLEQATNDRVVPLHQMVAMHRAAPHSRTLTLSPGTAPWIHARVDQGELSRAQIAERSFLREAIDHWRRSRDVPPARYIGRLRVDSSAHRHSVPTGPSSS